MQVVFLSNIFSHHQRPFCDAMYALIKDDFTFIETKELSQSLRDFGYGEETIPTYVIKDINLKNGENVDYFKRIIIYGHVHGKTLGIYSKNNIVFRYSERPFKKKIDYIKTPIWSYRWKKECNSMTTFLLSASAFAPADFKLLGLYKNKMYKWGYFPPTMSYDIGKLLNQKNILHILWCGRFIDWKHPDDAIIIAKMLKRDGYLFKVTFIGTGILGDRMNSMITEYNLFDNVKILGAMNHKDVRKNMESAGIFLFTSDRQEGWGAVLNEAMNSGCAVVASHAIGSVPYLMKDNENGLIYHSGNIDELYEKVKYLLDNINEQKRLGKAAYETITNEWNAEIAAERLINLSQHILNGEKYPQIYESGPCSEAEIIKDDWY